MCIVKTPWLENPGLTRTSSAKLRAKRTPPNRRTSVTAICATTSRFRACPPPVTDRELCRSMPPGWLRAAIRPGSRLASNTTARDTPAAKARTGAFSRMDAMRGVFAGKYGNSACNSHQAKISPPAMPARLSGMTSASNWRRSLALVAPRATRTAISRARALALAISRTARFMQPISNRHPTAASKTYSVLRTWKVSLCTRGSTRAPILSSPAR